MATIVWSIYFVLIFIGFYFLFGKAGEKGWKALIPFYNIHIALKITGRPWWWIFLFFIPAVNYFMLLILVVQMIKSFGKYDFWTLTAGMLFAPVYLIYMGTTKEFKYVGPSGDEKYRIKRKKSKAFEWVDALVFAAIAATIIRWFFIEAYTIPTSSMEKSMLVGDFLFVSKVNYGTRIPMTPIAFPFAHHTMPIIKTKSYVEWMKYPYMRLPGLQKIKNMDVVVFNYPDEWRPTDDRPNGRPVDKRENYIKRCVGIPGDTIKVVNQKLFVNSKFVELPEKGQFSHIIYITNYIDFINEMAAHTEYKSEKAYMDKRGVNLKMDGDLKVAEFRFLLHDLYNITDFQLLSEKSFLVYTIEKNLADLESLKSVTGSNSEIYKPDFYDASIFPQGLDHPMNVDYYGPIYIPKKGDKIQLNDENYKIYQIAIRVYEDNPSFTRKGDKFYMNDQEITDYTFKMDYYWMMGDNRHNSADSRMWGFVPEDHVVGKGLFIWMSWDKLGKGFNKVRWNRIFNGIH